MAYSEISLTVLDDVPGQVRAFAESLGWAVSEVSPSESTITHAFYTGALTFNLHAMLSGSGDDRIERMELSTGLGSGWVYSPKLNLSQADTASAVSVAQPTKLHLFGNHAGDAADPGDSWIAGVIEYGYNLYRHFYLGYAEKLSSYTGGEIVSGSWQYAIPGLDNGTIDRTFDNDRTAFPFSATGYRTLDATPENTDDDVRAYNGGMHLTHAGNAEAWRTFYLGNASSIDFDTATAEWGGRCVIGGYRDSINAGYLHAGKSPFAGTQVLTPINLYIGQRQSGQQFFQAVGRPAGARLLHVEDIASGQAITVGTQTWRAFPVFSRRSEFDFPYLDILNAREYPPYNTSYYVGMAYRET